MQTESFGTGLRVQRERQGVTLVAIAEQTKIKTLLLEGLERDDISRWPEGIFRRAYVRAYAKAISLDPDIVVRQFLEVYPEPVEPSPEEGRRQPRLRYLFSRLRGGESSEQRQHGDAALDPEHAVTPRGAGPRPDRTEAAHRGVPALGLERRLADLAALCTNLGRAVARAEIATALQEMVRVLDAVGVILWVWDSRRKAWVSALAHGYADNVMAQLPPVSCNADNAIASAFRSAETQIVGGSDSANGAIVAPLMTPNGCAGMLAIELQDGSERTEVVRAFATILAAQLATLISISAEHHTQGASGVPHVEMPADVSNARRPHGRALR